MILYNLPYRGPFEYDKMTLNALQFHNMTVNKTEKVMGSIKKLQDSQSENKNTQELMDRVFLSVLSTY